MVKKFNYVRILSCILVLLALAGFAGSAQADDGLLPEAPDVFASPYRPSLLEERLPPVAPLETQLDFQPSSLEALQSLGGIGNWTLAAFEALMEDGHYDLFIMTGDGLYGWRLTAQPSQELYPHISPKGDRVVYISDADGDFEIMTMNLDGSDVRQVTFNSTRDTMPSWSPDGSRILYVASYEGFLGIFSINPDGSDRRMLHWDGGNYIYPAWSPDGRSLAYIQVLDDRYGQIYLADADGGNRRPLLGALAYPGNLHFSPDSAYLSYDQGLSSYYYFNRVTVLNLATLVQTFPMQEYVYADQYAGGWSPDGAQVILSRWQYALSNNQLYLSATQITARCGLAITCKRDNYNLIGSGVTGDPDWQSMDFQMPQSWFDNSPAFQAANGYTPLTWQGFDPLPGALDRFEVEYRTAAEPQWRSAVLPPQPSASAIFPQRFAPGQQVWVRLRAIDEAGHVEPWTDNGLDYDYTFLAYGGHFSGQVLDMRQRPLPQIGFRQSPETGFAAPATDEQGAFDFLTYNNGDILVAPLPPAGYASSTPGFSPRKLGSARHDFTVGPKTNWLKNGEFNGGNLNNWLTPSGATPASLLQNLWQYSGGGAVRLRSRCQLPICTTGLASGAAPAVVDAAGRMFFSYIWQDVDGQTHQERPNGEYANGYHVVQLPSGPVRLVSYFNYEIMADEWTPENPTWRRLNKASKPYFQPSGVNNQVAATADDSVFIVFPTGQFMRLTPEGIWEQPVTFHDMGGTIQRLRTGVSPDGSLHFVWVVPRADYGLQTYHRMRYPDGSLSPTQFIHRTDPAVQGVNSVPVFLGAGPDGVLHYIYFNEYNTTTYTMQRSPQGDWSGEYIVANFFTTAVGMDLQGRILLLANLSHNLATHELTMVEYIPGQGWTSAVAASVGSYQSNMNPYSIVFDPWGRMYLTEHVYHNAYRRIVLPVAEAGSSAIEQRISIPADAQAPTLAFDYRLSEAGPGSEFRLTLTPVSSPISATLLYSDTQNGPWRHAWVDLQPWAGQAVTLTFSLDEQANTTPAKLDLDNIYAGEWVTFYLHSASPQRLPSASEAVTVTLRGENIQPGTTAWLDDQALADDAVQVLSAAEIQVRLPAGLADGRHTLKLIGPKGNSVVLPGGIFIGKMLFLPLTHR